MKRKAEAKKIIGWREWVSLPDLGIGEIKAKIDTGARSSSIHATIQKFHHKNGKQFVNFDIYPIQRTKSIVVSCRSEVQEYRKVRSSNGQAEIRPVILTTLEILGERRPIELTLTNRDAMGFRLLLGRSGFRERFLVDAGKSFYGKRHQRK